MGYFISESHSLCGFTVAVFPSVLASSKLNLVVHQGVEYEANIICWIFSGCSSGSGWLYSVLPK